MVEMPQQINKFTFKKKLAYKQNNDDNVVACHFGNEYKSLLAVFFLIHPKTPWKWKPEELTDLETSDNHQPANFLPLLKASNFQGQHQGVFKDNRKVASQQ